MKKVIVVVFLIAAWSFNSNAQDGGSTDQGSILIEANTGFGGGGLGNSANTGFGLTAVDGSTAWAIGAEGGYFLMDDLALKVGLGYGDSEGPSVFTYKLGAKYYIGSKFPVQLDITGGSIQDFDESALWLGLQGGYAIFLNDYVSIEPGLRYNFSLNQDFSENGVLELRVGFVIHL